MRVPGLSRRASTWSTGAKGMRALVGVAFSISLAGCGTSADHGPATATAAFTLSGGVLGEGHRGMTAASMPGMTMSAASMRALGAYLHETPRGKAYLRQSGDHLTGWIAASGLPPGSHHAQEIQGPTGACAASPAQPALVLPALVANAQGMAYERIDLRVHRQVVRPGYHVLVDRDPPPADEPGSAPTSPTLMRPIAHSPMALCGTMDLN